MRSRGAVAALLALLVLGTAWRRRANPFYSERGQDGYARRRDARLQDTIYVRRGFVPRARPWWSIRCLPEC